MINKEELRIGNYVDYSGDCNEIIQMFEEDCTSKKISGSDYSFICSHDYFEIHPIPLTEEWAIKLGFEKVSHYTVAGNLNLKLGRRKFLCITCVGTSNEMMFLKEMKYTDSNEVSDMITLHNYDYNGYLYVHELQNIISLLKTKNDK